MPKALDTILGHCIARAVIHDEGGAGVGKGALRRERRALVDSEQAPAR